MGKRVYIVLTPTQVELIDRLRKGLTVSEFIRRAVDFYINHLVKEDSK